MRLATLAVYFGITGISLLIVGVAVASMDTGGCNSGAAECDHTFPGTNIGERPIYLGLFIAGSVLVVYAAGTGLIARRSGKPRPEYILREIKTRRETWMRVLIGLSSIIGIVSWVAAYLVAVSDGQTGNPVIGITASLWASGVIFFIISGATYLGLAEVRRRARSNLASPG